MERLEYDKYGGPDVVHLRKFALPQPKPDELVVRVEAASINPMDWKIRNGDMKMMTGTGFPRAMGTDFAGIVETVGSDVSRFKRGDAVVGTVSMKSSGAFAPMLIAQQQFVVKKPEGLSFVHAAALPIAGVTAWFVLVSKAGMKRGQKLFINGASGAVGQAAIAIARDLSVEVVGRVGSKSVMQAKSLGLSDALDYGAPIPHSFDKSFDLVFDVNGSLSATDGNRLIKRGGKVIDIAPTKTKFLGALVSRSRKIVFADVRAENLQQVVELAAAGSLAIPVARTISLAEAPALMASLEQGKRLNGKAIIAFPT